jgi:SAM-dependent methyltransferase
MLHKIKDYTHFGRQIVTGWRLEHERWIAELRHADLAPYLQTENPLTVLDLANGQLQPQYKILHAQGHQVFGIDRVNHPKRNWKNCAYKIFRWLYTRRLQPAHSRRDAALVCGDVSILPFGDERFDLVTSVAAFEHFCDVSAVLKETHRFVRCGGFIWVLVHLFSAPSGGHNVSLSEIPLRKIPHGVDPWDHLRNRRLPIDVPLNEWRVDQYLAEFRKYFEILKHYCAMREGEHLLTPEIERDLLSYSRDELTCGAYVIVARKPA